MQQKCQQFKNVSRFYFYALGAFILKLNNGLFLVHECLFCPQTFEHAADKDDHILEHFARETCTDCNHNLIRIGRNLYTLHNEVTCIKTKFKSEEGTKSVETIKPVIPKQEPDWSGYDEKSVCRETNDRENIGSDAIMESRPLIKEETIPIKIEPTETCSTSNSQNEMQIIDDSGDSDDFEDDSMSSDSTDFVQDSICLEELDIKYEPDSPMVGDKQKDKTTDKIASTGTTNDRPSTRNESQTKSQPLIKKERVESASTASNSQDDVQIIEDSDDYDDDFMTTDPPNNVQDSICLEELDIKNEPDTPIEDEENDKTVDVVANPKETTGRVNCEICGASVSTIHILKRHKIYKHSPAGTIWCTSCAKICRTVEELEAHKPKCVTKNRLNQKPKIFKCTICNLQFLTQKNLDRHQTQPHQHKKFKCHTCGEKFISKKLTNRHTILKHNAPGTFPCDVCFKTFKTKLLFDAHTASCRWKKSRKQIFDCTICKLEFTSFGQLFKHKLRKHTSTKDKSTNSNKSKEVFF